jgi:hypothetical protein
MAWPAFQSGRSNEGVESVEEWRYSAAGVKLKRIDVADWLASWLKYQWQIINVINGGIRNNGGKKWPK